MVLLILEAHRALHLGNRIDERAQRVSRQRVKVPASVHVFELVRLMVTPLGVFPGKQKAFNFIGRVQGVAVLVILVLRKAFEDAANIGTVRRAVLVDHVTEYQDLARPKHVRRSPIERRPIDVQA